MVWKVCSHVQRQERGVVQGPVGDGRQGWPPGPLLGGETWRYGCSKTRNTAEGLLLFSLKFGLENESYDRKLTTHCPTLWFMVDFFFCFVAGKQLKVASSKLSYMLVLKEE